MSENNFVNNSDNQLNSELNLSFDDLLEQLDEYIEQEKTKETELPIAKQIYIVKPLSSYDEDFIKSSSFRKYNQLLRKLFELILRKSTPKGRTTGLDFNTLSKEVSVFDLHELSKSILEVTYEKFKTTDDITIRCEYCNAEYKTNDINEMNLLYADFVNRNKTWDKDIPFTEYTTTYAPEDFKVKVKNSDALYITFEFELFIPTLFTYLHRQNVLEKFKQEIKEQLQDLIPALQITTTSTDQTLMDMFPVRRDTVFMFVKTIKIKLTDTSNNTIREENITDEYKILQALDKLPVSILDSIRDKYSEEFGDYVPVYESTFKCKHCGSENKIILRPELNLIDRILM